MMWKQISWQAQEFLMWKCRVGGRCRALWALECRVGGRHKTLWTLKCGFRGRCSTFVDVELQIDR